MFGGQTIKSVYRYKYRLSNFDDALAPVLTKERKALCCSFNQKSHLIRMANAKLDQGGGYFFYFIPAGNGSDDDDDDSSGEDSDEGTMSDGGGKAAPKSPTPGPSSQVAT